MALDWPASPTVGAQYISGGQCWQWDGVKWIAIQSANPFTPPLSEAPTDGRGYVRNGQTGLWMPVLQFDQGGLINKFRNPGFDIWQRGASIVVAAGTSAITADGWYVNPTGGQVTSNKVANTGGSPPPCATVINFQGVAATTTVLLWQRLESYSAAPLAGQQATFSIWAYSPTAQTPQLSVSSPNAADNWSASTSVLPATNLQSLPASAWTRLAYTFAVPAAAVNGLQVNFLFPASLGTGINYAAAPDLRATSGWPAGLCANPPPSELRPAFAEYPFLQRYYQVNPTLYGFMYSATMMILNWPFTIPMRATPTIGMLTTTPYGEMPWNTPFTASGATINGGHASAFGFDTQVSGWTGLPTTPQYGPASMRGNQAYVSAEL